jgi:hypothetical protein
MRTVTWALITLCAAAGIYVFTLSPIGNVVERWETTNGVFKIRVDQRAEDLWFFGLPGAYYVFQSSRDGSQWREIMTVRHDDPIPIPRENVRIVNDHVAYMFMGWTYAVTTDAGTNWSVWKGQSDLPCPPYCAHRYIKDVTIALDGTGTMTLFPIREGAPDLLRTTDFGHRWTQPAR